MKRTATALAFGVFALGFNPAFAHGTKPQYGGIVASANDLSFELVVEGDGASLFVVDHDKPADASTMSGKLTILDGTEKSEAELRPVGGNKLEARQVKLSKGAKVVAVLTSADKKTVTARFTIR